MANLVKAGQYYNPVRVHIGPGAFAQLATRLAGRRTTLVTFRAARSLGWIQRVEEMLGDQLVGVIDDIDPNPDVAWLAGMYDQYWSNTLEGDCLIALGGGSVIDSAKVLAMGMRDRSFSSLLEQLRSGRMLVPHCAQSLIAVPTTAGTGSEVTPWATVWDDAARAKYSLHSDAAWPADAVIDPLLMLSLPRDITVSCGLDTLSHALEAIWNVNANPVSDALAVSAARDVLHVLPQLVVQLDDLSLRSAMATAAMKAGLAFSNTKTALAHSISYAMTLNLGLPHGIACSFTLPYVMSLAWGHDAGRDEVLRQVFGCERDAAIEQLAGFLHGLGVATRFSDYGVSETDADRIVKDASMGARGKNFIATQELA